MVSRIVFHIEGGVNRKADRYFRQAFRTFFTELVALAEAKRLTVRFEMEGSRREAYNRFCHGFRTDKDAIHILLVDSEAPIQQFGRVWQHLKERTGDGWDPPQSATDEDCHLMVEAMEAWFFADLAALANYYGAKFRPNALPNTQNVEQIPKARHIESLNAATQDTTKGRYHKTDHAPYLLERIDPAKVRSRAPHCERCFAIVAAKLAAVR